MITKTENNDRSTIKASVSDNILTKISVFFDNRATTIFNEMLQNCRRAGASRVDVSLGSIGDHTAVTIDDDGEGISDPGDLLCLGRSGWDEEMQGAELPAGMGFFSLCILSEGVEVASKDWKVVLTKESFRGSTETPVLRAAARKGTSISFVLPIKTKTAESYLRSSAQFYPVPVSINGVKVPQQDFLQGADYIMELPGGRIGVYDRKKLTSNGKEYLAYQPYTYGRSRLNFHGLLVDSPYEAILPSSMADDYIVRVDVQEHTLVDLVLPARDKVVQDVKYKRLKLACRSAVYAAIQELKWTHRLPFDRYEEARQLGYTDIPEAKADLRAVTPTSLHNSGEWTTRTEWPWEIDMTNNAVAESTVLRGDLSDADVAALVLADLTPGKELPYLVEENSAMSGYSWYPKMRCRSLTQVCETETEGTVTLPTESEDFPFSESRPAKVSLRLEIEIPMKQVTGVKSVYEFPTFIVFDGTECWDRGGDTAWSLSLDPAAEADKRINSSVLGALFYRCYDDLDNDSPETQWSRFEEDADRVIVEMLHGSEKAVQHLLINALNDYKVLDACREVGVRQLVLDVSSDYRTVTIKKLIQRPKKKSH